MKFRTKILICNMLVVALTFALCGTILIYKDYTTAIKQEIESEYDKNQMMKAVLETKIINLVLKHKYKDAESLKGIELLNDYNIGSDFCVLNTKLSILSGTLHNKSAIKKVVQHLKKESHYYIYQDKKAMLLLTVSTFYIQNEKVYLANYKNISYLYQNVEEQIRNFKIMFVSVIGLCCAVMYFIAYALTKAISQLHKAANEMSEGNYDIRSKVTSKDEIGDLNKTFNLMADSIQEHMEKLEEAARKKEEFVADFTHEIKTPLTSIIGYADMIRMNAVSDEMRMVGANYIYSEGMRLEKLSMKLFDLLLLDKKGICKKKLWVEALMEEVEFAVAPKFEKDGIAFECEPAEACINGDYEMLKTVFINLIDNARKASVSGQTVCFSVRSQQSKVCFTVKDNGVGIPEDQLNKITEAFYMVDKSRSRKQGGAGLGLALVQKIVELHEGEMKIESKAGEGTTFEVIFDETADDDIVCGDNGGKL